jgi:hypothetical protein
MTKRRYTVLSGVLLVAAALGCRAFQRGPSEQEIIAAVRKTPPAPPTLGPTYLANVEVVEVQERGQYRADGEYWPVRVRFKGSARIRITNLFQMGLVDERAREKSEAVDFVEDARFTRGDFGTWVVSYPYTAYGPRWRLEESGGAR